MAYRSLSIIPAFSDDIFSDRFTQIDNLFSRLTGEKPINETTEYNLIQHNKHEYELIVNVAGFSQDELEVSVLNNQLIINGKRKIDKNLTSSEEKIKIIHQGIKKESFSLSFNLEHQINIQQANLDKGLLQLKFNYFIPEEEKPKKINIEVKENLNKLN
ncbi:Hsp20 family protein [Candidatus Palibaumannia cicadellinicola]|uniref:Small heat shock protein IbpA homodimer n=1 Tax=Candidatus Palibaumannia cicadellinicola TaxID=186490 RepID=A0A0K2BLG6_9GAMM|nr:Hsp20 family protein [Candidatus Baumannia cicadellinicola]AKZ66175.1 small heat shock protein IbpA homodimer [Candidatus Baumannia cicadellinicola]